MKTSQLLKTVLIIALLTLIVFTKPDQHGSGRLSNFGNVVASSSLAPVESADYERTYTIHDDYGRSIQFTMDIPKETYEYYHRQLHTVYSFDDYEKFVTPEMFENIAPALAEHCSNARSFVMAALEIAQQIPYESNDEAYYPIETQIRNCGACDDKSFLAASIILARGYYTILLLLESENHMAIGVALSGFRPEYTVWYWEYRGREYYYCECTSLGWKIGEMPPEFEGVEAYIIDLGGSTAPPYYVDSDGDGLTDDEELVHGTSPYKSDTDNDGLSDYYEIFTTQTDPTKADSDNDGLNDGAEITHGTDPLSSDTDDDLWNDSIDPMPTNFFVPNLVIIAILGGIVVLVVFVRRRKRARIEMAPPSAPPIYYCPTCGSELTYVEQNQRWYCPNCKKYFAPPK